MSSQKHYNPLDKRNLGASVAEALLERDPVRLDDLESFEGAGVYALYYTGPFEPYRPMAERNKEGRFEWPIYVGEAMPKGSRKGTDNLDDPPGAVLFKRLKDHRKSIQQAENLETWDFFCRYLSVEQHFISLGEALLISKFAPLWNKFIDGFGNHNPGKGRHAGLRPRWDVLHPGRPWTLNLQGRPETYEQIVAEIETHLRTTPIPRHPKMMTEE
ncbi:Eco29kI family restriction endonuclease [Fodinicurvata sediminis]|uniref:Eco29kI family restriction endonuclease n=1 Tax=Fodinicurvata sediminis TaxID=1121832 RepID=UPI0003B390BC|nr:Eco29kI family restriction endonuclease [Fodinicurvata sediminis]